MRLPLLLYCTVPLLVAEVLAEPPDSISCLVTTLAGSDSPGCADGAGDATFNSPVGLAASGATLWTADSLGETLRAVTLAPALSFPTVTLAGQCNDEGSDDASEGSAARFYAPYALAVCGDGSSSTPYGSTLFVTDSRNYRIRTVDVSTGATSTLAGSSEGLADGSGSGASFGILGAVLCLGAADLLVSDKTNNALRAVDISSGSVRPFVGSPLGNGGFADGVGSSALLSSPDGLALDTSRGVVYVFDTGNNALRRVTLSSLTLDTIAGSGSVGSSDGTGTAASFNTRFAAGITLHPPSGLIFVADRYNHVIRVVDPSVGAVSTVAGRRDERGYIDGIGNRARMRYPSNVYLVPPGADVGGNASAVSVFVADTRNQRVRLMQCTGSSFPPTSPSPTPGETLSSSITPSPGSSVSSTPSPAGPTPTPTPPPSDSPTPSLSPSSSPTPTLTSSLTPSSSPTPTPSARATAAPASGVAAAPPLSPGAQAGVAVSAVAVVGVAFFAALRCGGLEVILGTLCCVTLLARYNRAFGRVGDTVAAQAHRTQRALWREKLEYAPTASALKADADGGDEGLQPRLVQNPLTLRGAAIPPTTHAAPHLSVEMLEEHIGDDASSVISTPSAPRSSVPSVLTVSLSGGGDDTPPPARSPQDSL